MKNTFILILTLFTVTISIGQNKNQILEEPNKQSNLNEKSLSKDTVNYQKIISDINSVYFQDLFVKKYKNDGKFDQIPVGSEDISNILKNYNIILESIIVDKSQKEEDVKLAIRAKTFNETYKKFYDIKESYKDFFKNKYAKETANQYVLELNSLKIEGFEGLVNDKQKIIEEINSFQDKSCKLKNELNKLMIVAKDDNNALKEKYNKLEKEYKVPYLKTVIRNMSNKLESYTDSSLDCESINIEKKTDDSESPALSSNNEEEVEHSTETNNSLDKIDSK